MRVTDPYDRRMVRINLTGQGNALRDRLPAMLDAVAGRALAGLTTAQREELIKLLGQVAGNMTRPASRGAAMAHRHRPGGNDAVSRGAGSIPAEAFGARELGSVPKRPRAGPWR